MGTDIQWPYLVAIRSAAINGGADKVIFHHTDPIKNQSKKKFILDSPHTEMHQLEPYEYLSSNMFGSGIFSQIYSNTPNAVSRSNILRAAILYREGGIYLDMDTITISKIAPLLRHSAFCGNEYIVWPRFVKKDSSNLLKLKSIMLSKMRKACLYLPNSHIHFHKIKNLYYKAVNGAILGSEKEGIFVKRYLAAMAKLPEEKYAIKHGLGTHLFQEIAESHSPKELTIFPPQFFYPIPPVIADTLFQPCKNPHPKRFLEKETIILHWYASRSTKGLIEKIDSDYIYENSINQPYCALAKPYL
jgi:hypothetical protein